MAVRGCRTAARQIMPQEITIRRATIADVDSILGMFAELDALHRQRLPRVFRPTSPRSRDFVTDLIRDPACALFVAGRGTRAVGQIVARIRDTAAHPLLLRRRFGEIDDLFVAEDTRRQGVGRRLIAAAEEWVRQSGISCTELGVWEFNEPAVRLYAASGYSTEYRRMRRILDDAR